MEYNKYEYLIEALENEIEQAGVEKQKLYKKRDKINRINYNNAMFWVSTNGLIDSIRNVPENIKSGKKNILDYKKMFVVGTVFGAALLTATGFAFGYLTPFFDMAKYWWVITGGSIAISAGLNLVEYFKFAGDTRRKLNEFKSIDINEWVEKETEKVKEKQKKYQKKDEKIDKLKVGINNQIAVQNNRISSAKTILEKVTAEINEIKEIKYQQYIEDAKNRGISPSLDDAARTYVLSIRKD